ncbi:FtsQ-type POTRA domain-containing protein [Specibacter cremeus]|uniref:FtsQ-type POTRA domain-containing protein n=1 Tax=Specibacter cremeus TaxID=1629051 RepID=UPI000F79CA70|nr:FtsQ-type POTRA domain-containing protein [Specibacter cremeus]
MGEGGGRAPKVTVAGGAKVTVLPLDEPAGATVLAFPGPARPRRRRRAWLAVAAVAAVVVVIMATTVFSPLLGVRTIEVSGNKLATGKLLQTVLGPLRGKPLPQVRSADVERLLAAVPQVKSVDVQARPPSTLVVHIVEREPVALLKKGDHFILVDPDGVELGSTKDQAKVALPLIDGGTANIGKDTFAAMTAVLASLPQSVLGQLASASAKSPDAVLLLLNDGKTVIWGNASEMALKAKVLTALVNAPAPTPTPGAPDPAPVQVYDVSAPRYPVTR